MVRVVVWRSGCCRGDGCVVVKASVPTVMVLLPQRMFYDNIFVLSVMLFLLPWQQCYENAKAEYPCVSARNRSRTLSSLQTNTASLFMALMV